MLEQRVVITANDHADAGVVKQIEAAAARSGIALPQGWKPETARRLSIEWSVKRPDELPSEVLDRAAQLFGEITRRF